MRLLRSIVDFTLDPTLECRFCTVGRKGQAKTEFSQLVQFHWPVMAIHHQLGQQRAHIWMLQRADC